MPQDYSYEYEYDPVYCYPNSKVLKNKLNIRDETELRIAEREITSLRLASAKVEAIPGHFDLAHLQRIHRFVFGDIYEWAGELRKVNISKGSQFCLVQNLYPYSESIFTSLRNEQFLIGSTDVPVRLAFYMSEINALHPFREGNSRTQRLFIEYLAQIAGFEVDFSDISPQEMLEASVESFNLSYGKINDMFTHITEPISIEQQRDNILSFFGTNSATLRAFEQTVADQHDYNQGFSMGGLTGRGADG